MRSAALTSFERFMRWAAQNSETRTFSQWLSGLQDARAKAEVARRVRRLALGNPGDVKPIGKGVSELRIHYGPGYRVYYVQRGSL
jgi:putative addiction module killer protein